jgi:hypothetical protein
MKKEIEAAPVCVFRDEKHEQKTKQELDNSKQAMQKILNEWLALGLGPCMGLNDLILRPRAIFDRAVNDMIKVPELSGPFKMDKTKYRDSLSIPDPSALFDACKKALQLPYCGMYGIFIVNDDLVEIDEEEAAGLIDSQSIYLSDPAKIELVEDLIKLCELMNKVNLKLPEELLSPDPETNGFFRDRFLLTQKSYPGPFSVSLNPAFLRTLIR